MSPGSSADKLGSADEAWLVAVARAGDRPAFAELVRRYQVSLRNLLRNLCRHPALADDLAQEAFLQAWVNLRSLREPNAFGGWLRKLAINSWRLHVRREGASGRPATAEVGDAANVPGAAERLDLNAALAALAPSVRLCIVLSYQEGMSHGEIAAVTQLPLGTVKSHIARGTARLRELLAAYYSSNEQSSNAR
jgi:RNA polymerase sigma-70 factor (ECF subfamily)